MTERKGPWTPGLADDLYFGRRVAIGFGTDAKTGILTICFQVELETPPGVPSEMLTFALLPEVAYEMIETLRLLEADEAKTQN